MPRLRRKAHEDQQNCLAQRPTVLSTPDMSHYDILDGEGPSVKRKPTAAHFTVSEYAPHVL